MTPALKQQPCKRDCPDRTQGCHGKCEKYKAFAEHQRTIYEKRAQDAIPRSIVMNMHYGWRERLRKKSK